MKEALYYQPHEKGVACLLCPKGCVISEGKRGFCRVRTNIGGKLYTANYAACTACALDPIEKKPLYHFYPGSSILSIGTWGCNFACQFCQNWQIAQAEPQEAELFPAQAVAAAKQAGSGNIGIAYTYSEPSVWYEYVLETACLARQAGLKNVVVTNGFINPEPLTQLLPFIDAMNIDVKAFSQKFYRTICAGSLAEVQRTVELAVKHCHVEITTLVVPGLNDDLRELEALAKWISSMDRNIPLHFSRYFPQYKLNAPPTPLATLAVARDKARQYLNYVYLGNAGSSGSDTLCPACGAQVISRGASVAIHLTVAKTCQACGNKIAVIL